MEVELEDLIHLARFLGAGFAMGLGAIGSAIGVGMAGGAATYSMQRQPRNADTTFRTMLLGQALAETPGIFALVIALLLGFMAPADMEIHKIGTQLGAGLSIGLAAIGAGVGLGLAVAQACTNVSRNPRTRSTTTGTMILGIAIAESHCVFAFLIALVLILVDLAPTHPMSGACAYVAAGICMGAGAIGAGMGGGFAASMATRGVGRYPLAAGVITRTMILGQAIAESPSVFSLVIAIILIFVAS